jgi:hypothetical protein
LRCHTGLAGAFRKILIRFVTADLKPRTIVGIVFDVGFPNCSITTIITDNDDTVNMIGHYYVLRQNNIV